MNAIINFEEIIRAVEKHPHICFLVFQNKIVYANKAFENFTGYSENELAKLNIFELLPKAFHIKVQDFFNTTFKNDYIFYNYKELPIIKKDGSLINCLVFFSKITYNSNPALLLIAVDITSQKNLERTRDLISDTTKLISSAETEEIFLSKLCDILKKVYGDDYICFGKINFDQNFISPYCGIGYNVPLEIFGDREKVIENFNANKIVVNYNKELFKKFNNIIPIKFFSVCAIPIKVENRVEYVLTIFSPFVNCFNENEIKILGSLKETIEFGIDKVHKDRNITILYKALENSPDWVLITDSNGSIIYANKTVERLTGYSKEELLGQNPRILKSGEYGKDFYNKMWQTLQAGKPFSCVIINKNKEGKLFKVEHLLIPVKIGDKITHYVALGKDLTREEKLEGEVYKLKFHDALTGVFNRYGFIFEVNNRVKTLNKDEVGLLILIDIFNFSHINKIYSDQVGDELLIDIAKLLENIYYNAIVAKTGGDEFGVFLNVKRDDIIKFIESVVELFKISKFSSKDVSVSINLGASIYPDDSSNINTLINNARTALNIAKNQGENHYAIFNKDIEEKIKTERKTKELIVSALENDWFEIFLQPYFHIANSSLAGFEALLRINHPERGILSPYYFIDALEESDFIFEVEKRIIKKITSIISSWLKKDYPVKPISINLTAKSFKQIEVIDYLINNVKNFNNNFINLEITERLYLEEPEYSKKAIDRLRTYGIKISLDDFGTGYSSLSYLTEIPIDYIKIDISFVRKFLKDKKTYSIIEAILTLAKKLKMMTIAEGVEEKAQLQELKKLGCDIAQGYLFAKPCPVSEAEKFLFN